MLQSVENVQIAQSEVHSCSVLHCVAVCCSVLQCAAGCCSKAHDALSHNSSAVNLKLQCVEVRCSALQ